jgi:Acyclic terpene utilisation family protein AtuA
VKLRVLAFVNHIPIKYDPEPAINQAMEWGIDYVIAQGTGKDWGPHWLGSGRQFPVTNFMENVRPYMRVCHELKVPFILSTGIAGARPQLSECLAGFNQVCREQGYRFDVGVIAGDVDRDYLKQRIKAGTSIPRMDDHPALPAELRLEDVDASTYIVAQMGPEPIMAAFDEGVDGVITGRALDTGLYMAAGRRSGVSWATSALFGKMLECAGVALYPGDPSLPVYGEVHDDESIVLRSPSTRAQPTVYSTAGHSLYERMNPFREENTNGYLDLEEVKWEDIGDGAVRVTGARYVETPYTVKLEGAAPIGYRSINLSAVREPRYLEHLPETAERIKQEVRNASRFSAFVEGVDYHLNVTLFGRDAVLGDAEPCRGNEHEVGVLLDVVAPTEEIARDICFFASISLQIGPYPGRRTTAGNVAQRFTQMTNPVGQAYRWTAWHLLPLEDPLEPFERFRAQFPYEEGTQPW